MIDRILNYFGYVQKPKLVPFHDCIQLPARDWRKAEDLTEYDLALLLAEKIGVQDEIDKEYEKKIFESLKGTEGLVQYLREAAARDKDRYFGAATKEEQLIIRGAFARTMYLKSRIVGETTEE